MSIIFVTSGFGEYTEHNSSLIKTAKSFNSKYYTVANPGYWMPLKDEFWDSYEWKKTKIGKECLIREFSVNEYVRNTMEYARFSRFMVASEIYDEHVKDGDMLVFLDHNVLINKITALENFLTNMMNSATRFVISSCGKFGAIRPAVSDIVGQKPSYGNELKKMTRSIMANEVVLNTTTPFEYFKSHMIGRLKGLHSLTTTEAEEMLHQNADQFVKEQFSTELDDEAGIWEADEGTITWMLYNRDKWRNKLR